MVLGSSPVAVTSPSDFAPASSKEFLDIQATTECGFTLKRVRDMTRTYNQSDIDKIYLYAKDPYEDKYQYLINKRESVGLKHFNDPKHLLSIQMICMMHTKILITITSTKKIRC